MVEPLPQSAPQHDTLLAELQRCERQLLRPAPGTTQAALEHLLDADFWEVGASGRRYDRAQVLEVLRQRLDDPPTTRDSQPDAFQCQMLGPGLYLLTYILQEPARRMRRTTLWRHEGQGWCALYHQGTVVV